MRLVCFTQPEPPLEAALEAEGVEMDVRALGAGAGGAATAALSAALREAEGVLAGNPPDAVLVGGEDDSALAAALVAVKLEIPTAWLGTTSGEMPLVVRVANAAVDATADATHAASAIRDLAQPKLPPS